MPSDDKDRKFFGFHRNILFLGLVSLFTDLSSEMIYPLLPVFLTSVLGVGITFVGLVEGMAEATASFLKLFSGWISDRWQKRKSLVVAGYTLSTLTRPLVADLVQPHLRGTAYGVYHFCIGLSTLPASLLMGFLWEAFSPQAAFSFGAIMALAAAALLWVAVKEERGS